MNPRGLILIYTGNGKGKTSAAMGNVFRALGHGFKVLVIQFFKGDWPVTFGEVESAKHHPNLEFLQLGSGFVKIMNDRKPIEEHKASHAEALEIAKRKLFSGNYDLVVLDEIIYALDYLDVKLLDVHDILSMMDKKPEKTHLILTGRSAPQALIDRADLVTEMTEVKHPFQQGLPAAKGIDF